MDKDHVLEELDILLDQIKELVDLVDEVKVNRDHDKINLMYTELGDFRLAVKRVIKSIKEE